MMHNLKHDPVICNLIIMRSKIKSSLEVYRESLSKKLID